MGAWAAAFLLWCCASLGAGMPSLSEPDDGSTVTLRPGESVRIVLPENATTGYRWVIDQHDAALVEALPAESRYLQPAMGSGGEAVFTFRARRPGDGRIMLKHWRSWEGDSSVIARFAVRVQVRPAG